MDQLPALLLSFTDRLDSTSCVCDCVGVGVIVGNGVGDGVNVGVTVGVTVGVGVAVAVGVADGVGLACERTGGTMAIYISTPYCCTALCPSVTVPAAKLFL